MKHLIALFCLALTFTACEGDPGPPGADGEVGSAFEIVVDFNASNNYSIVEPFGFTIVPSDVVLVYISWETYEGQDVWRLVPQNAILDNLGVLTYNYDFTRTDVSLFLDSTFNLDLLGNEWTQDQVFRIVIVPADFINGIDTTNYDNVINAINLDSVTKLN